MQSRVSAAIILNLLIVSWSVLATIFGSCDGIYNLLKINLDKVYTSMLIYIM